MKTHTIQHQDTNKRASMPMQQQQKIFGGGQKAPPVPKAIPPVTQQSTEVQDAARQAQMAELKKKGMKSTLLAGNTSPNQGKTNLKSLLG